MITDTDAAVRLAAVAVRVAVTVTGSRSAASPRVDAAAVVRTAGGGLPPCGGESA